MAEEICVLCDSKLESKTALKEHFRKHANKEIDSKGRPIPKAFDAPASITVPSQLQIQGSDARGCVKVSGKKESDPTSKISVTVSQLPSNQLVSGTMKRKSKSSLASNNFPHNDSVSFSNNSKSNLVTQTTPQQIVCDVCGYQFASVALAITHRWKRHPKHPSKFCCSYCGKQFPLKTILDNHIADQHSNNRPQKILSCEECGEKFYYESAMDYHAKVSHEMVASVLRPAVATPPPSKKIRLNNAGDAESVYYCHLCGSEYILKFNLRKHLEQSHSGEDTNLGPDTEIIRCTTCEAIFCNKKAYDVHNMYHQPTDMYVTSEEHRLQTVSRVDQDFDLRRVQIRMPKSVQGYARQKMNIVWNAQFSRLASSSKPVTSPQSSNNAVNVKAVPEERPSLSATSSNIVKEPRKSNNAPTASKPKPNILSRKQCKRGQKSNPTSSSEISNLSPETMPIKDDGSAEPQNKEMVQNFSRRVLRSNSCRKSVS